MYDTRTHSCKDRIVSLEQPHVRPIQRGKRIPPSWRESRQALSSDPPRKKKLPWLKTPARGEVVDAGDALLMLQRTETVGMDTARQDNLSIKRASFAICQKQTHPKSVKKYPKHSVSGILLAGAEGIEPSARSFGADVG